MPWWQVLIICFVAFVIWEFRRFRRAKEAGLPFAPAWFAALTRAPASISESVSVILRRQVPPRFEAPRSWLGGLPMMPDHIEWPRSISSEHPERGERPLHFVAQIACADLPAELWGGLGPRRGWLLLFIDPNQCGPEGPDAFRVLYVGKLGAERKPPADLGPVHDGVYTGARYDYCRTIEEVPSVWRRWPVDLVVVPNTIAKEDNRTIVAPDNFAEILYAGQRVSRDRNPPSDPEPFTWRGALYVLDTIDRSLAQPVAEVRIDDTLVEKLNRPGYFGAILAAVDAEDAKWAALSKPWLEGPEPEDETERARRARARAETERRRAKREALAAFLERHPTPDSIVDYLRQSHHPWRRWRAEARERVAGERSAVLAQDLDSPIPADAWQALKARLRQDTFRFWTNRWVERDGDPLHVSFEEIEVAADAGWRTGTAELVADYYVDAARQSLIPPAVLSEFEPWWRSLCYNPPHRLGGYHDGVQSEAQAGPARELLLFQIASDDAMHWCWGDDGVYYVFLDPDALKKRDFARARMTLECK